MKKIIFLVGLFITIIIKPVQAGGGSLYLEVHPNGNFNESRQYIVRAHINPKINCSNLPITFKFEDQKDGDSITVGSLTQPYKIEKSEWSNVNGQWMNYCGAYAKVKSADNTGRNIIVEVDTLNDGKLTAKHFLNFGDGSPTDSGIGLPWGRDGNVPVSVIPTNSASEFTFRVVEQKYLGGSKRGVVLEWDKKDGMVKYNVYAKLAGEKSDWGAAITGTGDNSAWIGLNAFLNYYLMVEGCRGAGDCLGSAPMYLAEMGSQEKAVLPDDKTSQDPILTIVPIGEEEISKIDELNKKVEDLQNQVEESKKKQNFLEQRLNQLMKWIKSVFPFVNS